MIRRHRSFLTIAGILALAIAACGSTDRSPTPTTTASASAAPSTSPVASASAVVMPSSAPSPATTPSSSAAACVSMPQTGILPSDRLTAIQVLGLPGRDVVRFEFGRGSLTPAGPPTGTLDVASPPFTEGPSGLPIDLEGDHALQVIFRNMSIMNDVGQPTFVGDRRILVTDASRSLRQVIIFDESEGQVGWYIGYDGSSCVTLSRDGDAILLTIDFGSSG